MTPRRTRRRSTAGTVAIFAGGLDRPYPPENLDLAAKIIARGGAHVSEMAMGHTPRGKDFPWRNRIISGMAMAVVVIEAPLRSGSLITARRAADQRRRVFAVPGSPLDPRASSTNHPIKEGAAIVTSVEDIIGEIEPMLARPAPAPSVREPESADMSRDADDSALTRIVGALGRTPVEIDEIIRFTGFTPAVVRLVLLELDLAGRTEHHPGGRVSLIGQKKKFRRR